MSTVNEPRSLDWRVCLQAPLTMGRCNHRVGGQLGGWEGEHGAHTTWRSGPERLLRCAVESIRKAQNIFRTRKVEEGRGNGGDRMNHRAKMPDRSS